MKGLDVIGVVGTFLENDIVDLLTRFVVSFLSLLISYVGGELGARALEEVGEKASRMPNFTRVT